MDWSTSFPHSARHPSNLCRPTKLICSQSFWDSLSLSQKWFPFFSQKPLVYWSTNPPIQSLITNLIVDETGDTPVVIHGSCRDEFQRQSYSRISFHHSWLLLEPKHTFFTINHKLIESINIGGVDNVNGPSSCVPLVNLHEVDAVCAQLYGWSCWLKGFISMNHKGF